jgi:agmatine deiminase
VIDPNFSHAEEEARLAANLAVLQSETDAMGRPLDVVQFPILPRANFGGGAYVQHCYINFAFVNGGLIVPLAGMSGPDADAMDFLRGLFPGRKIVGIPMPFATWAGGGVHCITQQLPAAG